MSSKFNSAITFRPTPQTCFPPLDPQTEPGLIPCGNFRWSQFVHVEVHLLLQHLSPPPDYFLTPVLSNVCEINSSPGIHQFTARLASPLIAELRVGTRCVANGTADDGWWMTWTLRWTSPEGRDLAATQPWGPTGATLTRDRVGNVTVDITGGSHTWSGDPSWQLMAVAQRYTSLPAMPRSRPPNPMIPLARA